MNNLYTVIVPRSAMAGLTDPDHFDDIVEAVVKFVEAMREFYSATEVSAKAMQAYHADRYVAEVNNGGHSQFIHNCHDDLGPIVSDILAGLTAMKLGMHQSIAEQMAVWVAEHPHEAAQQTGFEGGRARFLDRLDDLFDKAEKAMPMIDHLARWIPSWPDLEVVDDADYEQAIHSRLTMHPMSEVRFVARSVRKLTGQMTGWFQVGAGLACANLPLAEIKLGIGNGRAIEIDGQQTQAYYVHTNANQPRLCVVTKEYAAAYELLETDHLHTPRLRTVTRKLSHVRSETIAKVIELANKYHAPMALDLLLRKSGIDPSGAAVAPMSIEPKPTGAVVNWLVAAGGQTLSALSVPSGSALLRPGDGQYLATVTRGEVEEYSLRVEAGRLNRG